MYLNLNSRIQKKSKNLVCISFHGNPSRPLASRRCNHLHIFSQRMFSHCLYCVGYIKKIWFITALYLCYQIENKALRFIMSIGNNCSRLKRKLHSGISQKMGNFPPFQRRYLFASQNLPIHNVLSSLLIETSLL